MVGSQKGAGNKVGWEMNNQQLRDKFAAEVKAGEWKYMHTEQNIYPAETCDTCNRRIYYADRIHVYVHTSYIRRARVCTECREDAEQ